MIGTLVKTRTRLAVFLVTVAAASAWVLGPPAASAFQGQSVSYTIYTASGRRTAVVRTGITPETIALEQLAGLFGLTFTEDRAAGGLVIGTRGDRIYASPGQSYVRTASRVVALGGPVQRDRSGWTVPVDFLTKALGPAIGEPIVIRRSSRLVLVGGVRVPEIAIRGERTAGGARLVIAIQPATLHRVTREGSHLTVRFDATALDVSPASGLVPEFATAVRADGSNLVIDLGAQTATHRADDDRVTGALTIDLLSAQAAAPPKPSPSPTPTAPAAPKFDLPAAGLRTIVIDPGHGGDDAGATSPGGTSEKDLTLQLAKRLKTAIEGRMGLRVLLTRESDDAVPVDRRTELANNNKADAFISLHVNWSVRPDARGAQIYTPLADRPRGVAAGDASRQSVPIVGGGARLIDPVPWDMAQVPFIDQSATLGAVLARQLAGHNVPLFVRPAVRAPMRILMGANMPAVLVELGFLSNADDEKALTNGDWQSSVVESVLAALGEVRRGIPIGPDGGR